MTECDLSFLVRDARIARLLSAGLLPKIISDELGVPVKTVNAIRKKMKLPARPGQRPTSKKLLEKPRAVLTASILIRQYQRCAQKPEAITSTVDLDALLELYTALSHTYLARLGVIMRHMTLTHAWVLLCDYTQGRLVMHDCPNRCCHARYPVDPDAFPIPDCPFCQDALFPNHFAPHTPRRAKRHSTRKAASTPSNRNESFSNTNQP